MGQDGATSLRREGLERFVWFGRQLHFLPLNFLLEAQSLTNAFLTIPQILFLHCFCPS